MRRAGGGFKVTKTVTTSRPSARTTTVTKTKTVTSTPSFGGPSVVIKTPSVRPSVQVKSNSVKVKVNTPVGRVKVKKTYVVRRVAVPPPRRRFCLTRAVVFTAAAVALTTISLAEMDRVVIVKGKKGNFRCARDTDRPTCAVHSIRELGHLVEIRVTDSVGQTGVLYSDSFCEICGQYFMLRKEDINLPIEYQMQQQSTVVQGMPPGQAPGQQVVVVQQPPLPTIRPAWVKDRDAPYCMRCRSEFTVTLRRHHCRNCGKIFCTNCCNRKLKLRHLNYESKELTCGECASFLDQYWRNQKNPQRVVVNNTNAPPAPMPQSVGSPHMQPYNGYAQQPTGGQAQYYPPGPGVLPNPVQQPLNAPQPQYSDPQYNHALMAQQPYPPHQPYDPSQGQQFNQNQPQQYGQGQPQYGQGQPQYGQGQGQQGQSSPNQAQQYNQGQQYDPSQGQQFNQGQAHQQQYDANMAQQQFAQLNLSAQPQPQSKQYYPTQYSAHLPANQQQPPQTQVPVSQFTQIYNEPQQPYDPSRPQQFSAHGVVPSRQATPQTYSPSTIIPPHNSSGPSSGPVNGSSSVSAADQSALYPQLQPLDGHAMPSSGNVTPYLNSNPN